MNYRLIIMLFYNEFPYKWRILKNENENVKY